MEIKTSKEILRQFSLVISLCFPLFIGWVIPSMSGHSFRYWTLTISIFALPMGAFCPQFLLYPYKLWMNLGNILGWINSRLILGAVYILVLLPIAFIMKILNYDSLKTKWNNTNSYRENKRNYKIDLTRIF